MGDSMSADVPARLCECADLLPRHRLRAVAITFHGTGVDEQVAGETVGRQHLVAFEHRPYRVVEVEHDRPFRQGGAVSAPGCELVIIDRRETELGGDADEGVEVLAREGEVAFVAGAVAHGDRDTKGQGGHSTPFLLTRTMSVIPSLSRVPIPLAFSSTGAPAVSSRARTAATSRADDMPSV